LLERERTHHGDVLRVGSVPSPTARWASVLLVVGEEHHDPALDVLHGAVDLETANVDVATLALAARAALVFAPMSGLTFREQIRQDSLVSAERAAYELAGRIPAARVTHRALHGWGDVARLVRDGAYDVLALAPAPRRGVIRELVKTTTRAGTELLLARSEPARLSTEGA
jgi:hypothetical protein